MYDWSRHTATERQSSQDKKSVLLRILYADAPNQPNDAKICFATLTPAPANFTARCSGGLWTDITSERVDLEQGFPIFLLPCTP